MAKDGGHCFERRSPFSQQQSLLLLGGYSQLQDGDQLDQLLQSIHGCLLLQSVCMCVSVEREDKGGRERGRCEDDLGSVYNTKISQLALSVN